MLLEVFGGLALFLFGLRLLSSALEMLASSRMQALLERLTDRPVKGALFGGFATAILQSSSLLMVTVIGLLNANLLTLNQAVGIILGMEIGTTMTAQLISFNVTGTFMYFIIAGFFTMFFAKNERTRLLGRVLFGFGLIFMGMSIMSSGAKVIKDVPLASTLIQGLSGNLLLGVFVGTIFTAVVQSSSAITGLIIAMGMAGSITLPVAIALTFGANIGTCVTGAVASIGSKVAAKRASAAQIIINVVGVLIFLPFITQYAGFIETTSTSLPRQIANSHTIFNVLVTLIKFPFIGLLVAFITWLIPGKGSSVAGNTKFIDERLLKMPSLAASNAVKEVNRLGGISQEMLEKSRKAFIDGDTGEIKKVYDMELIVDSVTMKIHLFLDKLSVKDLTEKMRENVSRMRDNIIDIERVADLATNICEASEKLSESHMALNEKQKQGVAELFDKAAESYRTSLTALREKDVKLAERVEELEEEVDYLEMKYKNQFEDDRERKDCNSKLHTILIDTARDLERVGDHATNIADSILAPPD